MKHSELRKRLALVSRKWGELGGSIGGKSTSEAKATAARKNGAKGGRPRKLK